MDDDKSKEPSNTADENSDDSLVPSFFPSLAIVLGMQEKTKGSPLTEAEVLEITDGSVCMMMRRRDYDQISRPFRDVNPKDAWVDWHRVRSEVVSCYSPNFVFTVPTSTEALPALEAKLKVAGVEYVVGEYRSELVDYFRHKASRHEPVLDEASYERIGNHAKSIEVSGKAFTARESLAASLNALQLIKDLIQNGAIAVCCDSSYIAHSNEKWLELAEQAERDFEKNGFDGLDLTAALSMAFMQFPVEDANDYFSCGLHLLGLPDLIVNKQLLIKILNQPENPVHEARELFWAFAVYLIFSCKKGEFSSGNTFSTSIEAPRFRCVWEPCTYFNEQDIRFNYYGLWRFVDPQTQKKENGLFSFLSRFKR